MARSTINLPLVLTVGFVLLTAMLMTGMLPSPVTVMAVDCRPDYIPPGLGYDDCKKTETAEAAGPSSTPSGGGGGGGSAAQATATGTATRTPTATGAVTTTTTAVTPTLLATSTPTVARPTSQGQEVQAATPTPTPTADLPPGAEALVCVPGTTVSLVGEAAPGTALLAFFDDRPVGGGFSRDDGRFSIDLLIGEERPGRYLVEVRDRTTSQVFAQYGCEVPAQTPTIVTEL